MEKINKSGTYSFYVLSVDVGRKGCDSVVSVFKVTPQAVGGAIKSLVNMYVYSDMHLETQAQKIKELYYKYDARRVVIDGNGLGIGLIDYMVKSQKDLAGNVYPDFGIYNDPENYYKSYKTASTEEDAVYIIKANAALNTEIHVNAQTQLASGKVKLLIDERIAKQKLLDTKIGQNMRPEEREDYIRPFFLTSVLKEEMMNLREENEGININLKQANKTVPKDKFSALTIKKGE